MTHRPDRVASLIEHELSALLLRELEFPGALVTISGVEVTKKLDNAKISISVFPGERSEEVLKKLQFSQGSLQFKLGRILNIKPMPRIRFEIDYGAENAAQVEKRLLEEERGINK